MESAVFPQPRHTMRKMGWSSAQLSVARVRAPRDVWQVCQIFRELEGRSSSMTVACAERSRLMRMLSGEAGVALVARLVARVDRLERAVSRREAEEQIFLVDELLARIVRRRVGAGVHADGVTRARLDAVAAEDATELVDDEAHRVALVAVALVALRILARFDVDALRLSLIH